MKRLTTILGVILLLALTTGCRRSQADRYARYMEDVSDTTFEYIMPKADSLDANGNAIAKAKKGGGWADDDGLVAIPDIPQERPVNMSASDYEAMREYAGKGE